MTRSAASGDRQDRDGDEKCPGAHDGTPLRRLPHRNAADGNVRGRSEASSATLSSPTTVRPSKMRSTATDESTALNRMPASARPRRGPHQLARAEGEQVVGHESDRRPRARAAAADCGAVRRAAAGGASAPADGEGQRGEDDGDERGAVARREPG